jgi:hypothetical protein
MSMRWEYELMRDMLTRAKIYEGIPTLECQQTWAMLREAVHVMTKWDYKIKDLELALKKICDEDKINAAKKIAKEALATTENSSVVQATDKDSLTVESIS